MHLTYCSALNLTTLCTGWYFMERSMLGYEVHTTSFGEGNSDFFTLQLSFMKLLVQSITYS